jgi:hypothetical protein
MTTLQSKIKDLAIAFGIAMLVVFPYAKESGVFTPEPYNNVRVVNEFKFEDKIRVEISFTKLNNNCHFSEAAGYARSLGRYYRVPLQFPLGQEGDRIAGDHFAIIDITTDGVPYIDKVEVRTRHICNGVKVDKIMYEEYL